MRGEGVAKEARMADDVSDEPPVGDARTSWLPAPSAQILALGDGARRRNAAYQNAWQKLQPPAKTQPLKSSERRSLRQALQKQFAPALDAAEAIDAVLPTSKNAAVTRGRQDRTELILVDGVVALASQEPVDGDAKSRAARKTWVPTPLVLQRCPHILRQVAVHAPVAHGPLKRGADLYAGGVVGFGHATRETAGSWPEALFGGPIAQGELVAVCARDSWAPVAVGRFSKSSEDMVLEGSRGACVDVLLRVGDGVWPNTAVDESTASSSPPEFCVAAAAAAAESAADALALAAERNAARTAAAAAAAHAAEVLDLKARTKRLAKSLRQVADLRGRELKDDAQRAKAARGPALEAELAYAEARLAELQRAVDDAAASNGVVETAVEGAAVETEAAVSDGADAETVGADAETDAAAGDTDADDDADEEEDAAPPPSPDEIFRAAFLTTLRRDLKPPVLAAEAVGAAAKLGGASVKETSWKKAAKFLESLAGVVDCREKSKGVLEVVSVDWGRAPPFELVEKAAVADEFAALRATKRGGCVTVSVRRVRNKNCTFVDGLDGWGFDEARQKAVAAALRTKFSAAASVAARKGTEDNRKGKKFFSIMVQGKYAEQIGDVLRRDFGVLTVSVQAKKGLVTKKDRQAFSSAL